MRKGSHFFAISVLPAFALVACDNPPEKVQYASITGAMGCVIEQITNEPFDEYQFQGASRDGEWLSIAWSRGEDADGNPVRGAYNLNLVTGERVELAGLFNNSGTFSADGKYLVGAQYTADGKTDIYELNLETGETAVIAPDPQGDWLATYSPDGRTIAFDSYRNGGQADLYLYDRETKDLERLTNYEGYDAHPEFSPDGSKILFHRGMGKREDGGYDYDVFWYDLNSGEEKRLTPSEFEDAYGSWAPDGEHIVFSSDQGNTPGNPNLYVLSPEGQILFKLTEGNWADSYAYWTRDGAYVYFKSDRSGNSDIYRMPMNGLNCVKAG